MIRAIIRGHPKTRFGAWHPPRFVAFKAVVREN